MEDFTTYTEVDVGADITVTSTKIDSVANATQDNNYVYKDMTASHFSGNYSHDFEYYLNSSTSAGQRGNVWGMANAIGDHDSLQTGGNSYNVAVIGNEAADTRLRIYDSHNGTEAQDVDTATAASTRNVLVYATVERDESVGTYGTVYFYHYSDSGRTSLIYTQSVLVQTATKDYRYIYGQMNDGRTQAGTWTGYTQNLELNEGGASGPANLKSYNTNLKANIKSINTNLIANVKSLNTNV